MTWTRPATTLGVHGGAARQAVEASRGLFQECPHHDAFVGKSEMTTEHNMGLVRRMVEDIWNEGDLALADVLVAPGYVNHGGLIPDVARGPEAIKLAVALYRVAFPTFHITVETLAAEGEMVDLRWAAHRTPSTVRVGEIHDNPQETLRGSTRSRLADDQIAESWMRWDRAAVLHDLDPGPTKPEAGTRPSRPIPV